MAERQRIMSLLDAGDVIGLGGFVDFRRRSISEDEGFKVV
jgi:hypothetical protein